MAKIDVKAVKEMQKIGEATAVQLEAAFRGGYTTNIGGNSLYDLAQGVRNMIPDDVQFEYYGEWIGDNYTFYLEVANLREKAMGFAVRVVDSAGKEGQLQLESVSSNQVKQFGFVFKNLEATYLKITVMGECEDFRVGNHEVVKKPTKESPRPALPTR